MRRSEPPNPAGDPSPVLVVAIGASAGGLPACQRFLQHAPANQGFAYVVILHPAPAEEIQVTGILQRATRLPVSQASGGERIEADRVYVAPAMPLGIHDGTLAADVPGSLGSASPIDTFFAALAGDQHHAAVGIVLSGTGSDGSTGLGAIGAAGGLCLVQDPDTAEYDAMPRCAIEAGAVDAVLPPELMGDFLRRHAAARRARPDQAPAQHANDELVVGQHPAPSPVAVSRPRRQRRARGASVAPAMPRGDLAAAPAPRLLERLVLQQYTMPCVVIDQGLEILHFFGPVDDYLTRPQGEANLDLLSWVRPELYPKLQAGITEAVAHERAVIVTGMRLEREGALTPVEIVITPITSVPRCSGLFLVAFRDHSLPTRPSLAPNRAPAPTQLHKELEETRGELRVAVDQLRLANGDHEAACHELLCLNAELQSSHDEIVAASAELQSRHEELRVGNRQLEERNDELRSENSDLDRLLVSAHVPTLFLDRDLRIRRFTPSCATLMRIVPTDIGRSLSDIKMHLRDESLLSDAVSVLAGGAAVAAEVSTDDSRWYWRRALPHRASGGDAAGVCLTFHDITSQKRATDASEYARLYAETIIRTSRTPLLVLDMEHCLVSANAAFYQAFQVEQEHSTGRPLFELANGQWDIPGVHSLLEEALPDGGEVRDFDLDHVFARLGWRCLRLNAQKMSGNGHPDLVLVSIEDVTDLRRAEREAASRAEELALLDQRKDQFLALLGHELRNPLAAFTSGLELLGSNGGAASQKTRAMMLRQTERMTAMLDQLLDVSRVVSGKFELARDAADLAEAARAAVESVQPMLEAAAHELTVSAPPPGSVFVLGDAMRLAQVVENLLVNAAKYTDNGGRIELAVETTADQVTISVRDNGIGMEPAVLASAFDLFVQARVSLHRAKGGLGLGLALVRTLVQMHGGEVAIHSAGTGKGTEVVVTLPRLRVGQTAAAATADHAVLPVAGSRVLIVDDEADAAEALMEILNLSGHQARAVTDGTAALAAATELDPEVVLLDLALPQTDGYEVARQLRQVLGSRARLVALTGYLGDPRRLAEAGFDGHLLKPTHPAKLFALLAELDKGAKPTAPLA